MNIISSVKKLLNTENTVFRHFAEHYDMVYFGKLHQEDDEQRIVRGVTVSNKHTDEHYCVGTVHGYDVVLLKRTDKIAQANSTHTESYNWTIMQFDLKSSYDHPHMFIDGGHHDELFYQALFVKFSRLMKVDKSAYGENGKLFSSKFTAYTPPDALDDVPELLAGAVGETLAQHFAHLDFEWFQDNLIVYSTGRMTTKHLLEHMLRAGLWLTDILDKSGQQKISAHGNAADIHRDW